MPGESRVVSNQSNQSVEYHDSALLRSDPLSFSMAASAVLLEEAQQLRYLEAAICKRLLLPTAERAWRIASRPGVGRFLVAARDIAAGEVVFSEQPLVVARPTAEGKCSIRGEMAAVAIELLRAPADSPVHLLQEPDFSADKDGALAGSMRMWTLGLMRALKASGVAHGENAVSWALGVASTNVHGRSDPERGILGLLASMMEHNCAPNACADVASADEGSTISLRTKLEVRAGESLSISYVSVDTPVSERRRLLRLQHGFVCECKRCVAELAAAGEQSESEYWRHAWENRIWCGVDPYSGE